MIHIWAFLDLPSREILHWKDFDEVKEKAFSMIKNTARVNDCELLLFDGSIYRYDSGQGKFIKTKWDELDWEEY